MKVLIIGYGSIGQRHHEVLKTIDSIDSIDTISSKNIETLENLHLYDYFIISSITSKHYSLLKYLCSKVEDKKILVEKPLYDTMYDDIKTSNKIFTAYNLRFHPVIQKLKEILSNEEIYSANITCGQYLPSWRPDTDYTQSYSADIEQGGGVLRDLSHELDYLIWLFGNIKTINSINTKISDLKINSDDIFSAIILTQNRTVVNLSVDYISKIPMRKMTIHTKDNTYEADLIKNTIYAYDVNNNSTQLIEQKEIDKNLTYSQMHNSIINTNKDVCSFNEGLEIVKIIDTIKFEEV